MTSPRWLPACVAALLLAATLAIIAVNVGDAAGNSASTLTPIVPCRLADTRADQQVGGRGQPIPADTSVTFAVWGSNGECTIPSTATGIATNVTIVNPTASSFLTVYPSDAAKRPKASNLNWLPNAAATPNQVTVALSGSGAIDVYNLAGTVDVIIDIVGYDSALPVVVTPTTPPTTSAPTTTVAPLPTALQSTGSGSAFHAACGGCGNYPATVFVPAGRWLVHYSVTNVNFTGTSDLFRCWFETSDGTSGHLSVSTSRVGGPFPAPDVTPHSGEATITLNAAKNVRIGCSHDNSIAGGVGLLSNAYMETAVLTLLKVAP
jgi:hypothetical protein